MANLRSAFKEDALAAPKLRDAVVVHIHDLVALAIGECAPLGDGLASAICHVACAAPEGHNCAT